jgi:hypothetical protein
MRAGADRQEGVPPRHYGQLVTSKCPMSPYQGLPMAGRLAAGLAKFGHQLMKRCPECERSPGGPERKATWKNSKQAQFMPMDSGFTF